MISKSEENIGIRPFEFKYFDDIWNYSQNPNLYTYLEYEGFSDKNEFLSWILEKLKNGQLLMIIDQKSNICLGTISISDIDTRRMSCSIGYALDPRVQGQNIFGKSFSMLLEELKKIGFIRIWAITSKSNSKSIRALIKKGFNQEGLLNSYYKSINGKRIDALLYSLIFK